MCKLRNNIFNISPLTSFFSFVVESSKKKKDSNITLAHPS